MNKRTHTDEFAATVNQPVQTYAVGDRVCVLGHMTGTITFICDNWVKLDCDNPAIGQVAARPTSSGSSRCFEGGSMRVHTHREPVSLATMINERNHVERLPLHDPTETEDGEPREETGDYNRGWNNGWHEGKFWRRVLVVVALAMALLGIAIATRH